MKRNIYLSLDLETTGLNLETDKIIEVGMIKFDDEGEIGRFSSLVYYDKMLDPIVKNITGIEEEELKNAPVWKEVRKMILDFAGSDVSVVLGHNIGFDLGFLKNNGVDFANCLVMDTWYIASMLLFDLESYSLESLMEYIDWKYDAHRALNDALAVMILYKYLCQGVNRLPDKVVARIKGILSKGKWDYAFLFDEVKKVSEKISNSGCANKVIINNKKNPVAVKNDVCIKEMNLDEALEIMGRNDGMVMVVSDQVFGRIRKKYQVANLDVRSRYVCRNSLKELFKRDSLDSALIGILVKIIIRATRGFWDGYLMDIVWSFDEKKSIAKVSCWEYKCLGQCFFDERKKYYENAELPLITTYHGWQEKSGANILYWTEEILPEDGFTEMTKRVIDEEKWKQILDEAKSAAYLKQDKDFINDILLDLKMWFGSLKMIVRSSGGRQANGYYQLDVTPGVLAGQNFQSIIYQTAKMVEKMVNYVGRYNYLVSRIERDLVDFLDFQNNIMQIGVGEMGVSVNIFAKNLASLFAGKMKVLMGTKSIAKFGGKYWQELLGRQDNCCFERKDRDKINLLKINGSILGKMGSMKNGLLIFGSLAKMDEYMINNIDEIREKKVMTFKNWKKRKMLVKKHNNLRICCSWRQVAELAVGQLKFDMIYIDALPFDVPGELVTTYRAMNFGDDYFDLYTIPRVAAKINFLSNMINEGGEIFMGDRRFFEKKYGRQIEQLL